jgi:hypothetical protein
MPKQQGAIKLTGTYGDVNYYYHKSYGFLARQKPGPGRKRVKTSPEFKNTRRHNAEFGRASHYGKLLRHAFALLGHYCYNGTMYHQLSSRIYALLMMDKESEWGKRDLNRQSLETFNHFELDSTWPSKRYFTLPVHIEAGDGCTEVTAGIHLNRKPKQADAWKVVSVTAMIDLITNKIKKDIQESELFACEKGAFGLQFTHYHEADALLFYGLCIVFYRYDATTGTYKQLKGGEAKPGFIRYVEG